MHAVEPAFSFVNRLEGWVSYSRFDGPAGDFVEHLEHTSDGGQTWHDLLHSAFVILDFLDTHRGFAVSRTEKSDALQQTCDGGRTWSSMPLSRPPHFDQMHFLDANVGWVAGIEHHRPVVMRTGDGGRTWSRSEVPDTETAEIRDLHFSDATHGWLITWHFNDEGTRLFESRDGGITWTLDPDRSFQGPRRWLSLVRQVSPHTTFAFYDERPGTQGEVQDSRRAWTDNLLVSRDGGATWSRYILPSPVFDCEVRPGSLVCASTGLRVLIVQVRATN